MKTTVSVGVPLVLILVVSAFLIGTVLWKDPSSKHGHRVIKRSISLPDDLQDALLAAAAEDAPAYVHDKRFVPGIASLAGSLFAKAKKFDPAELTDTIQQLGSMKNMAPDIMAQSVKQEAEVTEEVEKQVAEETVDKLFAEAGRLNGQGLRGVGGGGGEIKGEVDFVADKGMVSDDMFAPAGMKMKVDIQNGASKASEPSSSSQPTSFAFPMGLGSLMANNCFGRGYQPGDPCYGKKIPVPPCKKMMEGCAYIGVGFDGRGDYSSTSRRKSVVQRSCKNMKKKYHGEDIPDTMNVHGIYDTDVSSYAFESRQAYRHSLQAKAGMSFSGYGFQAAVEASYGKKESGQKQSFMSLIECNVIRYEIFLDEITPDTLSLAFLRDFLSLPKNFIEGKAKLQKFIIRYGTHFIKSAKFGGSFRLFKTQQASKSESIEDFSIQAQASYNGLFAVSGHMGMSQSSGASSSDKTSRTHVKLEGGDQKVASIVADFYSTSFKETFTEWLKSIPTYPKPVEMFMGTMSELLDMNYKLLFPFEIGDAADGCFSENLRTEEGTGRKYYEVATLVNNTQGVMTPVNEKRYCDVTSVDKFGEAMDQKRLALERAIVVYMEEGPVPTTDFRLEGGKPGCTSQALKVKGGTSGATFPTWLELINGETYKVIFDLPEGISYDITKNTEALIVFSRNRWNCHAPGTELHMYNSFKNGGSGDTNSKKVSCFGFVMTYLEESGTFVVTPPDHEASSRIFRDLPRSYINSNVARAEYVSPLEHAKAKGNALASIVEAPCSVKWSNSYQIKPAEEGERCLYFVAASKGDIFVVFSAIPRDMTTWYHLQISFQGVALYKGMKLVKYEGAKSARSLGDSKLFQPYFICLQEDMENMRTYIKYGIGSDTSEKGLVYMVYTDASPPLGIRFYSFGSGEESVEIMDARVIEGGTTEMECTGGTIMQDGMCVEDCHPECEGCIPMSPGSKLDTECRACKHLFVPLESGSTRCVAECPEGTAVASDGRTCGTKWRADGKCGPSFPAPLATPGQCNKDSHQPCCSGAGECGDTADHCNCDDCVDYRCVGCAWLRGSSTWVEGFSGTSHAANGVTYDPAKVLDGNTATNWNPVGKDRYYNDWYIVLDLEAAHKLTRIAVNNYGDTEHDVTAFTLQKSLSGSPYNWEDVVAVTDARVGTNQRQEFDGFEGTARYWKFTVKRTSSGWQPWLRDVNFYGISTEVNVAVGKTADQSSGRDGGGAADRAVDGNTDGNWGGGSCTHTEDEVGATWWVDLDKSETIQRVVLWNRRDCCGDRLNPFNIYIGDSDQITTNPKCGGDHRIDLSKPSVTVPCEGMQGRYVGIRLVGGWSRPLTLCEVQVFATRSDTSD